MAVWKVLAERAAQHGIQPRQLREALVYGNLPSLFEPHEGDVREIVGYPELIDARREAQRAAKAAARAELLKNRSPILSDLAAGLAPPSVTTPRTSAEKTIAEPAVPPAASPPGFRTSRGRLQPYSTKRYSRDGGGGRADPSGRNHPAHRREAPDHERQEGRPGGLRGWEPCLQQSHAGEERTGCARLRGRRWEARPNRRSTPIHRGLGPTNG